MLPCRNVLCSNALVLVLGLSVSARAEGPQPAPVTAKPVESPEKEARTTSPDGVLATWVFGGLDSEFSRGRNIFLGAAGCADLTVQGKDGLDAPARWRDGFASLPFAHTLTLGAFERRAEIRWTGPRSFRLSWDQHSEWFAKDWVRHTDDVVLATDKAFEALLRTPAACEPAFAKALQSRLTRTPIDPPVAQRQEALQAKGVRPVRK